MAWNESGNDKDPWSGNRKQTPPPDLNKLFINFQQRLTKVLGKGGGMPPGGDSPEVLLRFWGIITLVTLGIIWFLAGFFVVRPAEQAVVLRFGKYVDTLKPGPHWIPALIETYDKVDEQQIENYSYSADMLTKDENIVSVAVAVQFRRANAFEFLYDVVNPIESLQQATASALRQVIGNTTLDAVLTSGREQVRSNVQTQLVSLLGKYQTGLEITDVALQPAKAPDEVKDAFDDAIKAQEDEQRYINQAQAYAKQVVPQAEGEAQRLLADATGYQQQVVLNAQGETARYLSLLPEYVKNPGVTRERLYLSAMENILTQSSKVFVDLGHNNNSLIYLPLDKWGATSPGGAAAPATSTPPSNAAPVKLPKADASAAAAAANPLSSGYLSFSNRENYWGRGVQP